MVRQQTAMMLMIFSIIIIIIINETQPEFGTGGINDAVSIYLISTDVLHDCFLSNAMIKINETKL